MAAGGPRVEVKKGGWAWAAEGRHWRPSTRQENGPPAAEGRPWGRLNLRGGPEATHPQGRKRKGEGERQWSGGGQIMGENDGRKGRPSTRKRWHCSVHPFYFKDTGLRDPALRLTPRYGFEKAESPRWWHWL